MCVLSSVIGASFLHALTGGAKVTTTARNGQHIAVEADHAHRGLLERRPYLTLASEIRADVAIANLHERPLREMHARSVMGGRCSRHPLGRSDTGKYVACWVDSSEWEQGCSLGAAEAFGAVAIAIAAAAAANRNMV